MWVNINSHFSISTSLPCCPWEDTSQKQGREKCLLCSHAVITLAKGGEAKYPARNLKESLPRVLAGSQRFVSACSKLWIGGIFSKSLVAGDAPYSFSALGFTRSWALHNMKSFRDKGKKERREKFCCSLETPPVMLKYLLVSLCHCRGFSEGCFQP